MGRRSGAHARVAGGKRMTVPSMMSGSHPPPARAFIDETEFLPGLSSRSA